MEFYSEHRQPMLGPVVMLPQKGSTSGGTHRPMNSFTVLRDGASYLFDAPFSWCLDDIQRLADKGHLPKALFISHRDLASSGDAFDALSERYGVAILMHSADQETSAGQDSGVAFADPFASDHTQAAGAELIHIPGHSPGSIMLYLPDEGGILLAGDSAVAPGPEQPADPPRLERPKMAANDDARFCDIWQKLVDRLPLAAVLPLHGRPYRRVDLGDLFDEVVANIWLGPPMDPSGN